MTGSIPRNTGLEIKSNSLSVDFRFSRLELDDIAREDIGRKAKRIIDFGRVKYLASAGVTSTLKSYVTQRVSLENVMLLSSGQTGRIG